ncbi:hypothetical protein IH575_03100, partial [Candidatus Dojkabacteria bacterium]|nr:hypothetical protein [Candidatus Dojkabacteria bacterium]
MKEFLAFIYRFLGQYEDLDPVWRMSADDGSNGMFWGFVILLAVTLTSSLLFYFVCAKKAANATLVKWFKYMLISALAVFLAEEIILSGIFTAADEESQTGAFFSNLIVGDDGKLILFSFMNTLYSLLVFWLWSFGVKHL